MEEFGGYLIEGLKNGIGDVWLKIKSKFEDVKEKIKTWAIGLKITAKDAGENFVKGLKEGLQTLKDKVKEPINALIGIVEKAINWIIEKLNKLSWTIPDWVPGIGGKKFGFNISKVYIPRLAKGGIVNNPGRGVPLIAGESGREAVLPLDNNTEWMDILADKINGNGSPVIVRFIMDGTVMYEKMLQIKRKKEFAANGVV